MALDEAIYSPADDDEYRRELWLSAADDQLQWASAIANAGEAQPPDDCLSFNISRGYATYTTHYDDKHELLGDLRGYYGHLSIRQGDEQATPFTDADQISDTGWRTVGNRHIGLHVNSKSGEHSEMYRLIDLGGRDESPPTEPGSLARFAQFVGKSVLSDNSFRIAYRAGPPPDPKIEKVSMLGTGFTHGVAVSMPLGAIMNHFGSFVGLTDHEVGFVQRTVVNHPASWHRASHHGEVLTFDGLSREIALRIRTDLPFVTSDQHQSRNGNGDICRGYAPVRKPKNGVWPFIADKHLANRLGDERSLYPRANLPEIVIECKGSHGVNERLRALAILASRRTVEPPLYPPGWVVDDDYEANIILRPKD